MDAARGSLPIAYSIGAGHVAPLPLDERQVAEVLLTAAQSLFGVGVLASLSLSLWESAVLAGLFVGNSRLAACSIRAGVIPGGLVLNSSCSRPSMLSSPSAPFYTPGRARSVRRRVEAEIAQCVRAGRGSHPQDEHVGEGPPARCCWTKSRAARRAPGRLSATPAYR